MRFYISDLEEEHAGADGRCDDRPAGNEKVAGIVANHVLQSLTKPPTKKNEEFSHV
jgi:hypothetical protein